VKYLLDTNVVSEMRKPKPHGAVVSWLQRVPAAELSVPSVVLGELQSGVERTRQQDAPKAVEIERWVDAICDTYEVVPMDAACFREWARLMHSAPRQLGLDAMVAATARVHDLTVATRNEADFRHFGVRVFNPFE
jgi:predicted nucleic acid-binding protein